MSLATAVFRRPPFSHKLLPAMSGGPSNITAEPPDPAVIAALVDNHRRFLAFLQKRVGSRADAEDILQDASVRGLARAGEIRDEDRAVAWFYRLLRNGVVDHWRARAARDRGLESVAREMAEAAPDQELEGEIAAASSPSCRRSSPTIPQSCGRST